MPIEPLEGFDDRIRYGISTVTEPGNKNVKKTLRSSSMARIPHKSLTHFPSEGKNATIRNGAPDPPFIFIGKAKM